jgi:hypothetical protein
LAEKYYKISPCVYVANNPVATIDPDGRFLFGLFGSTTAERRMKRANEFAENIGGTVRMDSKGRPVVGYGSANGDRVTVKTEKRFGDFFTLKNFGCTIGSFFRTLGNEI